MKSILAEAINWLDGSRYGKTYKDKIVLFLYIVNALIVIIFIASVFGTSKVIDVYFKRTYLLNWVPVKSVLIRRYGILLSLPIILDYIILVKPDWEEKEIRFVTELDLNHENTTIIDAGANMGIYTILFSHLFPKSKIISIEASPVIFDKLQLNCKLNNLHTAGYNLFLINKAVSDKDGMETEFYESHSMSTICKEFLTSISNSIIINDEELSKKIVRTVTIDSLVEIHNIDKISLLKMDIEGSEVSALKGAVNTLNKKMIKNLLIEYHSSENYDYTVRLLGELGYKVTNSQERYSIKRSDEINFVNGHIMATLED